MSVANQLLPPWMEQTELGKTAARATEPSQSCLAIVEHFWDEGFGAVTNIVDVYFSQLRNKIDGGHEAKVLHAVRGMGYTIREHEHQNWI